MSNMIIVSDDEGSFAAAWNEFVEEEGIPPAAAAKLQYVFYKGAAAVFNELDNAAPKKNTPASVHASKVAFEALEAEVEAGIEEMGIEDLTKVGIIAAYAGSTGGIQHEPD